MTGVDIQEIVYEMLKDSIFFQKSNNELLSSIQPHSQSTLSYDLQKSSFLHGNENKNFIKSSNNH